MIKLLKKNVSDKIAAGEVVESPYSVVKELIENSIDAGATSIICEIKKGGSRYIRVTDNGCGIPSEEVWLAFTRHATSKIRIAEDLDNLNTLGFRGEALASIATVSNTEIITKTSEEKLGTKLDISGGKILENKYVGAPDGTTIIVKDLFFNTPARRKFMKSNSSESAKIIEFMKNISLAYPKLKIRMISNDSILFATNGNGNRLDVIITLNGKQISEKLIAIKGKSDEFSLEGYISGPGESRANKKEQVFFVNGRVVESKTIEKAVSSAYKERLFDGRHPIAFLFLEVNPHTIDVNIHPNKKQIRFQDDEKIINFLRTEISNSLMKKSAIPELSVKSELPADKNTEEDSDRLNPITGFVKNSKSDIQKNNYVNTTAKNSSFQSEKKSFDNIEESAQNQVNVRDILSQFKHEQDILKETFAQTPIFNDNEVKTDSAFDNLIILATIFDTYIICCDDDTMYMIDQHAAHERINYENILNQVKKREVYKQTIMFPITFTCIQDNIDWIAPLDEFGFTIEEFGVNTYITRTIPSFFDTGDAEKFLKDYISEADKNIDFRSTALKDKMAMKACKASVKANEHLKAREIQNLIDDLKKCKNPYSCPHGRPTFIKITKKEIEKRFKRIV